MPQTLKGSAAVALDGNAYVLGGYNGANGRNEIWSYNPETNTFTTKNAKLTKYLYSASATIINKKIYIFGGRTDGSMAGILTISQCYDPLTDTLTQTANMSRSYDSAAVTLDNKAYIFGGYSDSIYCYDADSNSFSRKGELILSQSSAVVINNKAYIIGGKDSSAVNTILRYDANGDVLTTESATLASARFGTSAVSLNNRGFVFGGYNGKLTPDIQILVLPE